MRHVTKIPTAAVLISTGGYATVDLVTMPILPRDHRMIKNSGV